MKRWLDRAKNLLRVTLQPPRQELNEIDWKVDLSPKTDRLAEHLSAFANYPGGGFLVLGVTNSGEFLPLTTQEAESIVSRLGSVARAALEPPVALDHIVAAFDEHALLFVHVPESQVKPVHLRGKPLDHAFIRSAGTTRQASRHEIGAMMLNSRSPRWEDLPASNRLADDDLPAPLSLQPIFDFLARPAPTSQEELLDWLTKEQFISLDPSGGGYITNLGAIAAAHRLADFPDLARKAVRVIVYSGKNKANTKQETEGSLGYAVSFPRLIKFVMSLLPQSEIIERALRVKRTIYPELALREIIANALIHQDFSVSGAGPLIEIFDDRIEISNPGGLLPSKRLDRLIGTQPESRNEKLARAFRRYGICEERGSGLLKAGLEVELFGLPPIHFHSDPSFFKVTLFAPRTFAQMSSSERLEACYQHAVLKHVSGSTLTNKSLRERLKMPERQRSMVSALIQEAVDRGMVKPSDPDNRSKKFAEYVPFWA